MQKRSAILRVCTTMAMGYQDYSAAMKWYRMAADQGYANAQYGLGIMYDNGRGAVQDYSAAMKWYRMAADQGHANAQ